MQYSCNKVTLQLSFLTNLTTVPSLAPLVVGAEMRGRGWSSLIEVCGRGYGDPWSEWSSELKVADETRHCGFYNKITTYFGKLTLLPALQPQAWKNVELILNELFPSIKMKIQYFSGLPLKSVQLNLWPVLFRRGKGSRLCSLKWSLLSYLSL